MYHNDYIFEQYQRHFMPLYNVNLKYMREMEAVFLPQMNKINEIVDSYRKWINPTLNDIDNLNRKLFGNYELRFHTIDKLIGKINSQINFNLDFYNKNYFKIYHQLHGFLPNHENVALDLSLLDTLPPDDVVIDNEDKISISNNSYSILELENTVESIFEKNGIINLHQIFSNTFIKTINEVIKIKDKLYAKALLWIITTLILPILFVAMSPEIMDIRNKFIKAHSKEIKAQIKSNALKVSKKQDISNYKYVTANVLVVRLGNSQKTPPIGKLYFGQIVQITMRKRNWTQIEWHNRDLGIVVKGWVFSRYLEKIIK